MKWLKAISLALLGLLGWVMARDAHPPPPVSAVKLQVQQLLGSQVAAGFTQADKPRRFNFPQDHGQHPDFHSEWWYVTGNLESDSGQPFGFQLTFFRQALQADPPKKQGGASAWRGAQLYMAHFTVCDVKGAKFYCNERFSRAALELAGATSTPLARVWLEDWSFSQESDDVFNIEAQDGGQHLKLRLKSTKEPVLQGEDGLSRKGPKPGEASYYYSLPRLQAEGQLSVGGRDFKVSGVAWLDREWSSRSLPPDLQGWDWFCLQMQDNSELMFYRLRRPDGSASQQSAGSYVDPQGKKHSLTQDDLTLTPTSYWASPVDGTRYPLEWNLQLHKGDLTRSYTVKPRLQGQELNLAVRYWEGAIEVQAGLTKGVGFLELVGYPPPPNAAAQP